MLLHPLGVDAPETLGETGGVHEPDGHSLAVAEVVAAGCLEGVAQGVAVVQDGAPPGFALVAGHHLGLDGDAPGDALVEIAVGQRLTAEEVILRHLPKSAAVLAWGQRLEHLGVAQDGRRLPEGAHQVLALRKVDPGLAADGGVDLGEEGGGRGDPPDAANPAVSVTTPPPTATTTSPLVSPHRENWRQRSSTVSRSLAGSPSPMVNTRWSTPASTSTPTPSWVTMAAREAPRGITSRSRWRAPRPTRTS